jgi:hypothetical protein
MGTCNKDFEMDGITQWKRISALVVMGLMAGSSVAQSPDDLLIELRQLRADLQHMKQELADLKRRTGLPEAPHPVEATGGAESMTPSGAKPSINQAVSNPIGSIASDAPLGQVRDALDTPLSLFGYGELYYARPRHNNADAVATARRGVLGFGYRFNERTRFAAELEIENAVVSASDQGEAAFEQLYVEHDLNDRVTAKAGLFLLPIGYMNEVHEPTRYYGVTRNLVETAIIPTTWREMGVGLQGTTPMGLRWNAGVVTSFDLGKWKGTSRSDTRESPLGSLHQEGQNAKAAALAYYGALNYDGIPGVNVGASLFSGGIGQHQADIPTPHARVNLAEWHAKWQLGRWELTGLTAWGQFRGVAAFNASSYAVDADNNLNPVPDQFRGGYAQAAYRLWRQGDYSLVPFARVERVNTAVGFSGLAPGLAPSTGPDTRVMTWGANFYLHPQVVLKFDTQRYLNNSSLDRIQVGIGFHY